MQNFYVNVLFPCAISRLRTKIFSGVNCISLFVVSVFTFKSYDIVKNFQPEQIELFHHSSLKDEAKDVDIFSGGGFVEDLAR